MEQFEALDRTGYIPPGIDVVFDLAGYGNMAGQRESEEIYTANLTRVIHSLNWLEDGTKFIYISTSSVTLPKQTDYSLSKRAAEEFIKLHVEENNIKAAIARPYTITGVGEQREHLIPKLIDSCLNGTEMPFVLRPVHDFLNVDDFVNALLLIAEKGEMKGEVYEIGSGVQHTNEEVKYLVEKVTGRKANVRVVDMLRQYDTDKWMADNSKLKALGWKPTKTLEQSITEMYEAHT